MALNAQWLSCWCLLLSYSFLLGPAVVRAGPLFSLSIQRQLGLLARQKQLLQWSKHRQAAAWDTSRVLRQQQPILDADPACSWSKEGDDDAGQCYPLPVNWILVPGGLPSSPYRRTALMALERDKFCGKYTKEGPCKADVANRCFWDLNAGKSKPTCSGSDVYEVAHLSFRNFNASINSLPLALTCPGTLAKNFYSCYNYFGGLDACNNLPACTVIRVGGEKQVCMPKVLLKMKPREVTQFFDDLFSFSPKVYGNCAGACWISQGHQCAKATNTSRTACESKAYCDWRPAEKLCTHRVIELGNDFDKKVFRIYAMCVEIDNQKDCEFNSKAKISEAVSARWRNHTELPDAVECKL